MYIKKEQKQNKVTKINENGLKLIKTKYMYI